MTGPHVSIQFLGAAGTVTGSKHLLKTPEGNILVDCGLFQGLKSLRAQNWEPLAASVRDIQCVLLTHAHLDHCGYLPLLVKQGFNGRIYCTAPTAELAEIILRDSAKIQEEDAAYANRKGYSRHHPAVGLYTEEDVEKVLPRFTKVDDGEVITLTPHVKAVYKKNGHILGSAFIEVDCFGKRVVFSGDLGRPNSPLLNPPSPLTAADFVVMESTYGDRLHPVTAAADELATIIVETIRRKGNLLIPSFAVGRAQELMHLVNQLKRSNRIPDVPVFMDSPMGADATQIFCSNPGWHKLSTQESVAMGSEIHIVRSFDETRQIIERKESKIIIAASGMLTGGRALFYLEHYVGDEKNTILFTGYQAEGTRGRALQGGAHELKMHGMYFPVRAAIRSLESMSGHADQREMLDWLSGVRTAPSKLFLVHGENASREAFRIKIQDTLHWDVALPVWKEEFDLFEI